MVYLSSSKFSIAVLGNLGFAFALSVYKIITWVRFPCPARPLRATLRGP